MNMAFKAFVNLMILLNTGNLTLNQSYPGYSNCAKAAIIKYFGFTFHTHQDYYLYGNSKAQHLQKFPLANVGRLVPKI